jgi:two-component system nitrate/nitrite response regulator NarL
VIETRFYCECLAATLAQSTDVKVVAALCGNEAIEEAVHHEPPEIILLDTSIPRLRPMLAELGAMTPSPKIVALAISETPESIAECANAGVIGYLSKSATVADLLQCLQCASQGAPYCSPGIVAILLDRIAAAGEQTGLVEIPPPQITPREREILELVGSGFSNKIIAARLNISHATAKNHVHHILEKLQLRSRTQVAAYLQARATTRLRTKSFSA